MKVKWLQVYLLGYSLEVAAVFVFIYHLAETKILQSKRILRLIYKCDKFSIKMSAVDTYLGSYDEFCTCKECSSQVHLLKC